jgi:Uma2 family endonuclease
MAVRIQSLFDTPASARMSAEDYIASPQSMHKSDLIEGVFVMASPASVQHEDVTMFIGAALRLFVTSRKVGLVLGSNAAFRLNEENVYQPDVSFVANENLDRVGEVVVDGPPDLAVEVISPGSRQYDMGEKFVNYARFGVEEYWVIDPLERAARIYRQLHGQLAPLPLVEGGILRSQVLPGFWLRLDWLFPPAGATRPSELDVARAQGLI